MQAKILSIYNQYATAIISGSKLLELRKRPVGMNEGDLILLYETVPDSVIRGGFIAGKTIVLPPHKMWEKYAPVLGCEKFFFDEYYSEQSLAYGTQVLRSMRFSPVNKDWLAENCPNFVAPQATVRWRSDWPIINEWKTAHEKATDELTTEGFLQPQLSLFE